jgi:hypothetical protein
MLLQIGVARLYDTLRTDPRFEAVLRKVGLQGVRRAAIETGVPASMVTATAPGSGTSCT